MGSSASSVCVKLDVGEKGFEVRSPCGRVWFIPYQGVCEHYASFQGQSGGGIGTARAPAEINDEFVRSWFAEQFDWTDVERYGRVVQPADEVAIKRALDFVRDTSNSAPFSDYVVHDAK